MGLLTSLRLVGYILGAMPEMWQSRHSDYQKLVNKRLRALVKHAYDNVDLYRQKYDQAGVHPNDIQTIDDLQKLPIVTKKDLIDGFPQAILARGIKPEDYCMMATSGSTGIPIRVYCDRVLLREGCLLMLFIHRMLAKQSGSKLCRGMVTILDISPHSLEALLAEEMAKLPRFMTKACSWLDVQDDPREHLYALAQYHPDVVVSYPSVLRNMAVVAREEGLVVHQPKSIIVTGELMDENSRQVISSVFASRIINYYVATEAGLIAFGCGHGEGMHVRAHDTILELLQDGRPVPLGTPGSVVVTHLRNKSTPIIRYSGLGDVAVFSSEACPCGSKLPLLEVVEGRIVDSLVLPDGRLVHPYSLMLALEHIPMIAQFQIIQETTDRVRILILPERSPEATSAFGEAGHLRDRLLQSLKEVLGGGIDINIELVPEIPKVDDVAYRGVVRSLVK